MSEQFEYANDIRNVNVHLFERYKEVIQQGKLNIPSSEHITNLISLCDKAIDRVDDFTIDKHSRWLGYIQGFLSAYGFIDVEVERNYTRGLYQTVYRKYHILQETI